MTRASDEYAEATRKVTRERSAALVANHAEKFVGSPDTLVLLEILSGAIEVENTSALSEFRLNGMATNVLDAAEQLHVFGGGLIGDARKRVNALYTLNERCKTLVEQMKPYPKAAAEPKKR